MDPWVSNGRQFLCSTHQKRETRPNGYSPMRSARASTAPVYSAPRRELPIANAKYVKNCDEMFLGKRGITHVRGMEEFANLEVLWLHGNEIASLTDELEENTRLKRLFLHDNLLKTLTGLKLECLFLEKLTLFGNRITDLDAALDVLKRLRHLEELDLQTTLVRGAKLRIKSWPPPSLHVFDRHVVTDLERRKPPGTDVNKSSVNDRRTTVVMRKAAVQILAAALRAARWRCG